MLTGLRDNPDSLIDIILRQSEMIRQLQMRLEKLEARMDEQSGRGGGAAPFRRPEHKRKQTPLQPGRGKGHEGSFRQKPDRVDRTVESPLLCCPHCQGAVESPRAVEQYLIDIPAVEPVVTRIITTHAYCARCRRRVRSTHPLQVSSATGAAGVHLGPRALALGAQLRHVFGLTMSKTCGVLEMLCGLQLTTGGLSQALHRMADKVQGEYQQLIEKLRLSAVVYTDETSWWVQGPGHSLWVWCNEQITLYRVVQSRSRATFHETIPPDYPGVLVSDCLSVYDTATPVQQKCYAHHLKAISQAREEKGESAVEENDFLAQCRHLLVTAIEQSRRWSQLSAEQKLSHRRILQIAAEGLLQGERRCPYEESIRLRLHKQRDHLFTFLQYEGVDPTNNLAERQLRPAVISRKLSCGNKTLRGARTWEILASLAATARMNGSRFYELISAAYAR